jgi:hypothetical protein
MQVKQLLEKNDKGHVIATCWNPSGATGITDLKNKFAERLKVFFFGVAVCGLRSTIYECWNIKRIEYQN